MKNHDMIKQLYFKEKYNQTEIANKLNISNKYVSKVLNKDSRYKPEKERRKELSKNKHKKKTIEYIKAKRKKEQNKIRKGINTGYDVPKKISWK